jgi:hypothetical protein
LIIYAKEKFYNIVALSTSSAPMDSRMAAADFQPSQPETGPAGSASNQPKTRDWVVFLKQLYRLSL